MLSTVIIAIKYCVVDFKLFWQNFLDNLLLYYRNVVKKPVNESIATFIAKYNIANCLTVTISS